MPKDALWVVVDCESCGFLAALELKRRNEVGHTCGNCGCTHPDLVTVQAFETRERAEAVVSFMRNNRED